MTDRERIADLALTCEEYMRLHTDWVKEQSPIVNLLRRVSQETVFKVLKHTRQPKPPLDKAVEEERQRIITEIEGIKSADKLTVEDLIHSPFWNSIK